MRDRALQSDAGPQCQAADPEVVLDFSRALALRKERRDVFEIARRNPQAVAPKSPGQTHRFLLAFGLRPRARASGARGEVQERNLSVQGNFGRQLDRHASRFAGISKSRERQVLCKVVLIGAGARVELQPFDGTELHLAKGASPIAEVVSHQRKIGRALHHIVGAECEDLRFQNRAHDGRKRDIARGGTRTLLFCPGQGRFAVQFERTGQRVQRVQAQRAGALQIALREQIGLLPQSLKIGREVHEPRSDQPAASDLLPEVEAHHRLWNLLPQHHPGGVCHGHLSPEKTEGAVAVGRLHSATAPGDFREE